jgi:hypothetical protein
MQGQLQQAGLPGRIGRRWLQVRHPTTRDRLPAQSVSPRMKLLCILLRIRSRLKLPLPYTVSYRLACIRYRADQSKSGTHDGKKHHVISFAVNTAASGTVCSKAGM